MIMPKDILELLQKYSTKITYEECLFSGRTRSLGDAIRADKYNELSNELYEKVIAEFLRSAELEVKIEAYQAIIENIKEHYEKTAKI